MSEGQFSIRSQISLPYTYAVGRWYGAFLVGLTEERLVGSRCPACATVAVPARGACPVCSAASAELVEVGPGGTVVAAAADARPGGAQWLVVRPDGADTTLLAHGDAAVGARVEAVFDPSRGPSIAALTAFRRQ
jgi:uncharacterized OB-fold protein